MTTRDSKENLKFLEEFFAGQNLLTSAIPMRTKIAEACKSGKTIWEYDEEASSHYIKVVEAIVKAI
jgi:chromosome partitioning protein